MITGTGTAPTQAVPVTITVKDGSTVVWSGNANAFVGISVIVLPNGGIAGTAATSMTISITDPGANNNTQLNIASTTG